MRRDAAAAVSATATTVPLGHSSLVVSPEVYKRIIAILRGRPRPGDENSPGDPDPDKKKTA